jgi:hypothetical protein
MGSFDPVLVLRRIQRTAGLAACRSLEFGDPMLFSDQLSSGKQAAAMPAGFSQ